MLFDRTEKSIIVFKIYICIMIQSPMSQISLRSTEQLQQRIRADEQRIIQVGQVAERGERGRHGE